jgi:hypothetical protein
MGVRNAAIMVYRWGTHAKSDGYPQMMDFPDAKEV